MRFCQERGMSHYVYAPKDDPKHRQEWREPYEPGMLDGFRRLVAEGTLTVGFGISPGLSIDYGSAADRAALATKVDQVVDVGVGLVCLALDDIPFRDGLGEQHADLTRWLCEHLAGRASLVLVPTEYCGSRRTPYLDALADGVPGDVPIGWTGEAVMNDEITAAEARARAAAVGGRSPLVWDNYPVNDGMMGDRLHLGPLRGRDPDLHSTCVGYLANPMVQPGASKLPLGSVAAFIRGDDALDAWAAEADTLGWRVFAEATDGAVPRALVQALATSTRDAWVEYAHPLAEWLQAAATCAAPGIEDEAGAWIDQVHLEASVGLDAVRLVQATRPVVRVDGDGHGRAAAPDSERALQFAGALWYGWPALRRSGVSVMGVRLGFRPELGQRADGRWAYRAGSLLEDQNAIDELCRYALDELVAAADATDAGTGLVVGVDGAPVALGPAGSFAARPGALVTARWGESVTACRAPCEPPLRDRRLR
jgi:hypothetical protein